MIRDAIIDEVRAVRDEIAQECGYDVHELFKALRREEASSTTAHVSLIAHAVEPAATQPAAAAGGTARRG